MTDPGRDDLLGIGRFARLAGLTIGALRHYDAVGLLTPARVDPQTGYRSYRASQLEAARLIGWLRDADLPLPQIRLLLDADPVERRRRLAAHRSRAEARTVRIQRLVHQLSQEVPMTSEPRPDLLDAETHRQLGVDLFNHVWRLLETADRTPDEDDLMAHAAHASVFHWTRSAPPDLPQRRAVGEWQCSRVYAVLGRGEPALHHARRSLALAEAGGVDDWVVAAAYEGMARASSVAGERAAFEAWREKARAATAAIADPEDREVIEGDLATLED